MSRDIKFRIHCADTGKILAYEKFNTCLNWGYYWYDAALSEDDQVCETLTYFKHPEALGRLVRVEFTGLTDKNGTEIYEGDILQMDDLFVPVEFNDGCFQIYTNRSQGSNQLMQMRAKRFAVVGNIYQNPELLVKP